MFHRRLLSFGSFSSLVCRHLSSTSKSSNALNRSVHLSSTNPSSSPTPSWLSHSVSFDSSLPSALRDSLGVLAARVVDGDRQALSRSITIIESSRYTDRPAASFLLTEVLELAAQRRPVDWYNETGDGKLRHLRIGISGPPGVGKSTFIEKFGQFILQKTENNTKLAVLSIDPSSIVTGGSILGDKTRMEKLTNLAPHTYIRPSPNRGMLGGTNKNTFESLQLTESNGFNVTLIETVGVGQSEIQVRNQCDILLLLVSPGGGDELQGMKKGIVECADMIIVNKADGATVSLANHTKSDYSHAVNLLFRLQDKDPEEHWQPRVYTASALENGFQSMEPIWRAIEEFDDFTIRTGQKGRNRQKQRRENFWQALNEEILTELSHNPNYQGVTSEVLKKLESGLVTPRVGAQAVLDIIFKDRTKQS